MTHPRRWFQIHLSTAVVMMLVAAALIYASLVPTTDERVPGIVQWYGWPLCIYMDVPRATKHGFQINFDGFVSNELYVGRLAVNILSWIGILLIIGFVPKLFNRLKSSSLLRLHLSTLVALTLITGGFLGLNLTEGYCSFNALDKPDYGWPFVAYTVAYSYPNELQRAVSWFGVFLDATIFFTAMGAVGFTLEYRIRRRKAQT
jgi:hypothetical protein